MSLILRGFLIVTGFILVLPFWFLIGGLYHIGRGESPFAVCHEFERMLEWAMNVERTQEKPSPVSVGSTALLDSRAIPLKRWALCCYGQIAVALIMGALGMIDQHTVIPACYFGVVNIVVGVIASEKKVRPSRSWVSMLCSQRHHRS